MGCIGSRFNWYNFFFFIYLVRCPTSYIQAQCTRLHLYLTRTILHIASLAAHTTSNIYKPMEISPFRGRLNTDSQAEHFAHENDALTARPQLQKKINKKQSKNWYNYKLLEVYKLILVGFLSLPTATSNLHISHKKVLKDSGNTTLKPQKWGGGGGGTSQGMGYALGASL